MAKKTTAEYIATAMRVKAFKDRGYTYDNTVYRGANSNIQFTCPAHGAVSVNASGHINKNSGCPACGQERANKKNSLTTAQFIDKARKVKAYDGKGYTYEMTEYTKYDQNIYFSCPTHGTVSVIAGNHLAGRGGCPACGQRKNHVKPFKFEGKIYASANELAEQHGLQGKPRTAFLKRVGNFSNATAADIRAALDTEHTPNGQPIACHGVQYNNFTQFYKAQGHKTEASYNSLRRYILDKGIEPEDALMIEPNRSYGRGLVYKLTCNATNMSYVGQTTMTLERRIYDHILSARKPNGPKTLFHKALAKYGESAFTQTILAANLNATDELSDCETAMIGKHNTLTPNGYNTRAKGQSSAPQGKPFEYAGVVFKTQSAAAKAMTKAENISIHCATYRISKQAKSGKVIKSTVKLDINKAREIREISKDHSHSCIAALYGVSRSTISMIIRGETWKETDDLS